MAVDIPQNEICGREKDWVLVSVEKEQIELV